MTTNDMLVGEPAAPTRDLRSYGRVLWRWKFLLLAFLIAIPVATYLYEKGQPKVYKSSALVQVTGGPATGVASLFDQIINTGPDTTDLLAAAQLVYTPAFADEAAKFIQPSPTNPDALLGSIGASADTTTDFMTLTATGDSPSRAASVANAFAQALVSIQSTSAVTQLNIAIKQTNRQLAQLAPNDPSRVTLLDQLARFQGLKAAQGGNAQIMQIALPSATPISPRVSRTVILALIVALLLGLGAVAVVETSDRRIRHPDDAVDSTGLPLLSAIPASAFTAEGFKSHLVQESFATLRAALTFFNVDYTVSSVLVTSPGKDDGKTTVAVQLARALASAGKDVILLDADLRRPCVAARLGLGSSEGLGSVLAGELSLDDALIDYEPSNGRAGRMRVLPAGPHPPNPSELLGSRRMRELVSELTERSDILVIDSTPMLTVSDSMPLLQLISGVVLVARVNQTSREAMSRLRSVVDSAGGRPLGVVATGSATGGLYVASGYGYETAYAPGGVNGNGAGRLPRFWRRRDRVTSNRTAAADPVAVGVPGSVPGGAESDPDTGDSKDGDSWH